MIRLWKWLKCDVRSIVPTCEVCNSEMYWREQVLYPSFMDCGYWVCTACEDKEYAENLERKYERRYLTY